MKRNLRTVATLLASWAFAWPAFGQEAPVSQDKSSWVLGYALVLLGIALGLVAVCRPGNRSSEVRVEEE